MKTRLRRLFHRITERFDPNGLYVWDRQPCCVCEQLTHRIEVNFEAYVHLDDCDQILWDEYLKALGNG